MSVIKIDLYTDIACPWCLIGHHRLDDVIAKNFSDLAIDIEHHPVILIPDCPPEGVNIAELMQARGVDPIAMRTRPEAEARTAGLVLDLGRQPTLYPTIKGHTLIRLARERGTQHALSKAIAAANFIDARNIDDSDVLADIAAAYGFEREEAKQLVQSAAELAITRQAAADSAAHGVRSVPQFFFNGAISLNGHQSEAAFIEAIRSQQHNEAMV